MFFSKCLLTILTSLSCIALLTNSISELKNEIAVEQPYCKKFESLRNIATSNKYVGSEGSSLFLDSKINEIFVQLHALNATKIQTPEMKSPCYFWNCTNMRKFKGKQCSWCLPYAVIAGFSKCGTTALADTLMNHPRIKFYNNRKEIKLFAETKTSEFFRFESRIRAGIYNESDLSKMWIEATASLIFSREGFSALLKYSPHTKIIVLVRDPYQRLGSWLSMEYRDELHSLGLKSFESPEYVRWLGQKYRQRGLTTKATYPVPIAFPDKVEHSFSSLEAMVGSRLSKFLHAEILLSWRDRFQDLLVLDHYDQLRDPGGVVRRVERFLGATAHKYPEGVLGNRVNTVGTWKNSYNQTSLTSTAKGEHVYIFPPDIRKDLDKWFLPSLCLFRWVFGFDIKVVTP